MVSTEFPWENQLHWRKLGLHPFITPEVFPASLRKQSPIPKKKKKYPLFPSQPFFKTSIGHTNYLCPYHPWDWYIYLYLLDIHGKCREIYQSHGSHGSIPLGRTILSPNHPFFFSGKTRWECAAVEESIPSQETLQIFGTPWKVNGWSLQITHLEMENDLNQTSMIMFHVNLQGCMRGLRFEVGSRLFCYLVKRNWRRNMQKGKCLK